MHAQRLSAILSLLILPMVPNLQAAPCSNVSLKGTYAFSAQGFAEVTHDVSPAGFVPFSEVGLIVYDGKGTVTSGSFSASTTTANGGPVNGGFSGTYSVNEDCLGEITLDLSDNNLFHFDLVVQSPSIHLVLNTDPGGLMSVFSVHRISGETPANETR